MMGDFNSSMTSGQPSAAAWLTLMPFNCSDKSLVTKPMPRNCGWNKSWPKASFQRVFNPLFCNFWFPGCCTTSPGSLRGLQPPTASPAAGTATHINEELYPKCRPLEKPHAPPAPFSEAGEDPKVATITECLVGLIPLKNIWDFNSLHHP